MLAQIHRLLDRYRGLPADSLLEQPVMFALFMGIVLANLVLFLASPLASVAFCPTGGITLANAGDYLSLPNVLCVGMSSLVTPPPCGSPRGASIA